MVLSPSPIRRLDAISLRQGQVKHALKTATACSLATVLTYYFRLPSGQFAPLFAFLIMGMGMPSPRLNWALAQFAIVVSACVSAVLLVALGGAPFLYLAVTLVWIFFCMQFANRFLLAANLGAMVSAIGVFTFFNGTPGETLWFFFAYSLNFLVAGFSVVVIHTLLWSLNTRRVFLQMLARVYAELGEHCQEAAEGIRSGVTSGTDDALLDWAPFRPLRQFLAPELRTARDSSNPFARMILACRSLNLRIRFFSRSLAPGARTLLSTEVRERLTGLLERCGDQLHALLSGVVHLQLVPPLPDTVSSDASSAFREQTTSAHDRGHAPVGVYESVLYRVVQDLQAVTKCHNNLLNSLRSGLAGELLNFRAGTAGARLFNVESARAGIKLVVLILLLLLEEGVLGFPGGSQVAFYATFFASTGNLGRQNKNDLVGLIGLLIGFAYGVVAAFITGRLPYFPLLLALVFQGELLASLAYQRLPQYSNAGMQAGLAMTFAYLAATGPEWGSFVAVRTRFWGLVVAGFTAVIVHAYLWPVLPMRHLRDLIGSALRDVAASLCHLFTVKPRSAWEGPPASLGETVARARDLLDDARYLPGPESADPVYNGILACLQEIDANLEYVQLMLSVEKENALRERFFRVIGDYADQARENLGRIARQLHEPPDTAHRFEPVRWAPDLSHRWQQASAASDHGPEEGIDPWRPAVIARCLDEIARSSEQISLIAYEINLHQRHRRELWADRADIPQPVCR